MIIQVNKIKKYFIITQNHSFVSHFEYYWWNYWYFKFWMNEVNSDWRRADLNGWRDLVQMNEWS